ncbi:cytochrome P450 [Mycena olivaceomarginata]|nr:cytochrome P450 [Mycena olivaceomarginata]
MAVAKSSPRTLRFTRPKVMRPVRAVRLVNYDPLNRFVAAANIDPDPRSCLYARVPEDQIMCEFFVTVVEGMIAPVYLLSLAAYDPRAGETETIRLARFTGFPGNADAPLWTRRLPPRKLLHFSQPRAFVARLVGGMTDISVKPTFSRDFYSPPSPSAEMLSWARCASANLSVDIPQRQRLSDEEVIGQNPTFLLAGHETTSSAIAWALHSLSLNQEAQTKLREELLAVSSDSPTMDELNSLVWLECVDDVLPLGKPYIDQNGGMHDSLPIRKGQIIYIPILANVPKAANNVSGMWANLLTFFAGPHDCIGFRFSLVEQKAANGSVLIALPSDISWIVRRTAPDSTTRHFSPGSQALLIPLQYSCSEAGETVSAQHALVSMLKSFEIKASMRDPPAPSRILCRLADQRAITRLMVSVVSIERFTKTSAIPTMGSRSCPLRTDHIWSPYIFILHPSERFGGLDSVFCD